MSRRTPLALLLLLAAAPAGAAELSITAPPGYVLTPMAPSGEQKARFSLRRPPEADTTCQIAYVPAPQNARMTQEQINALVRSPGWQNVERARLLDRYQILALTPTEVKGRTALEVVADFRPRDGLPERALQVRSYFALIETPAGRTTTVCVAEKAQFEARQAEFRSILQGLSPP
ncbi:hypothetical protein NON00_15475 [Roseomonas sp. GC11]|uniref:hypothetical protein n=1 Tax=Roseomonas sp. GC11 TaxID=2950546 RepID=UPI002108DCE8|nr:hypothetical protein [Roseomonas sp. GC11]MCQ4161319.1 hypothetical protein [Roseomonas sp. GC11]